MKVLIQLAQILETKHPTWAAEILKMAGRYDKISDSKNVEHQPAYKYIMYLKLMRGIDNETFHYMKRKYINTSMDVQKECEDELDKLVMQDVKNFGMSSAEIHKEFLNRLKSCEKIQME